MLEGKEKKLQTNINIMLLLLELPKDKFITTSELANKMQISKRTILRYLTKLKFMGYAIESKDGSSGGVKLFEDYDYMKYILTTKEISLICSGLELLMQNETEENQILIQKILAILPKLNDIKNKT